MHNPVSCFSTLATPSRALSKRAAFCTGHGHQLMLAVEAIEIVAGIGVAVKPRIFAYVVAAWLFLIILNLLAIPGYFDGFARLVTLFGAR